MNEFDKLMKNGSKRKDFDRRQASKKRWKKLIFWTLGVSLLFTIIPPHIGIIVFLPSLVIAFIYSIREWIG